MTRGLDLPSYMCAYTINALSFIGYCQKYFFLYFYWGWLNIHWARDRLMLQHVARASQTFWICAIYTNLHLIDNCTVFFYSASLHILKWRYQTFCFWLLIIYHPLKVPGFPISRFSPVPDDKCVHVVNHAAKNLSHRKKKLHLSH